MGPLAAQAVGELCRLAAEFQIGTLAGQADDLHILPGHAVAQAGSDSFHACLFGGKSGGQAFRGVGLGQAIMELRRGENTSQETLPEPLDRGLDARDFSDVNSCAYNHLARHAKVSYR